MVKRGQVSIEYLMLISFVTFAVLTALGIAFFYAGGVRDSVKFNQVESFADRLISLAESVSYAGPPATTTMEGYLPQGVEAVELRDHFIIMNVTTDSGLNIVAFRSNVRLQNGTISPGAGTKVLRIVAFDEYVSVTEN